MPPHRQSRLACLLSLQAGKRQPLAPAPPYWPTAFLTQVAPAALVSPLLHRRRPPCSPPPRLQFPTQELRFCAGKGD